VDLGTAVASAWSSGISMWAVAAFLGIAGRLGWVSSPAFVQEPWVIAVALVLAATELVVDKVAYLDSAWDTVHTVLRPLAGALLLGSSDVSVADGVLLVVGGLLALSSHAAKASARLLVNTSPEPVSNVFVSAAEDGLVALLLALAVAYPGVALVVTLVLAVFTTVAAFLMYRAVRAAWRRRPWVRRRSAAGNSEPPPVR
jgi:hypothetical protein